MQEFVIESLEDHRLDPYRALKQSRAEPSRTFIAEGEKLVRRLIDSPCRTQSVLCTAAARARLELDARLPAETPLYLTTTAQISSLVGFQFHRGVLACGVRPEPPSLESLCHSPAAPATSLIVACPDIRDPENLGTIIRTTAALGGMGIIAGLTGTDPFSRRVLRTSMGTVLQLPIVRTDGWIEALDRLRQSGFETIATVLESTAQPLEDVPGPNRAVVFFGNEDSGLPADLVAGCDRRVTLPMSAGVDSLNVAVAAGIVLYHLTRPAPGTGG
ncbi:MAG: TrmH family RNA methyltransferase [Planctomycetales bacterium]